jgi:hypothetical protein
MASWRISSKKNMEEHGPMEDFPSNSSRLYLILGKEGLGIKTNAMDASWCDEQGPVVYVQGKDTELVAF